MTADPLLTTFLCKMHQKAVALTQQFFGRHNLLFVVNKTIYQALLLQLHVGIFLYGGYSIVFGLRPVELAETEKKRTRHIQGADDFQLPMFLHQLSA